SSDMSLFELLVQSLQIVFLFALPTYIILVGLPLPKVTTVPLPNNHEITGRTSATKAIDILRYHGCPDVTWALLSSWWIMSPTLVYTGGFGNIYEGRLIRGWKKVAIKCSRFQTSHTNKALSALETVVRELYIWLQLDHANIVNLHGLARFQGCVAMVSPWMNNGNVREFIRERPSTNRYLLCYYVASGLEYLHGVDVIHGDLKGVSLLLTQKISNLLNSYSRLMS
ncbi:hypothetical protein FRC08_015348, partial [Ceratobasidium sp. 394]